ncbi:RusA family crossover junction endodeoxyribonuclease [Xanthobacter sp. V2C-8]|uniref:RusA family crossover junction endodeoxyribonuclease n=1 Tax=Xanthobacter albus TaxID=3119929 RepID=UPI00372BD2B9
MPEPITIILAGEPHGKGRPRFTRAGHAYTDAKTRRYEDVLRLAAQSEMGARPPLDGPVSVQVEARMPVPVSWSRKKQAAALAGEVAPTSKPDIDNIIKSLDALNQVVFRDDRQIVHAVVRKLYHQAPALIIRISEAA